VESIAFKNTLLPQEYQKTLNQRTEFEEHLSKLPEEPIKKNIK